MRAILFPNRCIESTSIDHHMINEKVEKKYQGK